MKINDIMNFAVKEGMAADPRPVSDIKKIMEEAKKNFNKLQGIEKEVFDMHTLESPYSDTRIIWGDPQTDINQAWVGIDIDTSELLLVKKMTESGNKKPLVLG